MAFGDPATVQMCLRWVGDRDPPEQRPAAYGWSMGQLTIRVAGVNITATRLGEEQQPYVGWYLAPFLDWLATNWAALLHEERYPWPRPTAAPAAIACNRALDQLMAADDPAGRRDYAKAQDWYFRHGLRSAAAGGIFPDLFIRRVADEIELSWSGLPTEFTREGLVFESGAGYALLPVADVASAIWQTLEWAVDHPPVSSTGHRDDVAALRTKVRALRALEYPALACAHVPADVLKDAETAFAALGRMSLFLGDQAADDAPYIDKRSPAVAMFGGVAPNLGTKDVKYLCDQIAQAEGGSDGVELATLLAERQPNPLGVPPYRDGDRFAGELLEDLDVPADDFVDVHELCARLGIVVLAEKLKTDSIRGVAIAGDGFSPRICVNLTHHFNGNDSGRRFTIAHELCHVLFDRARARRVAHVSGGPWAAQGVEQRANAFAAYLLMPRALVYAKLPDANPIEKADVRRLAGQLKVNESALLSHLYNLGIVDETAKDRLGR